MKDDEDELCNVCDWNVGGEAAGKVAKEEAIKAIDTQVRKAETSNSSNRTQKIFDTMLGDGINISSMLRKKESNPLVVTSKTTRIALTKQKVPDVSIKSLKYIKSVGSNGTGENNYRFPSGLTLSTDEQFLLIVDKNNNRIIVADSTTGLYIRELKGPNGTLNNPSDIEIVPSTGNILVLNKGYGGSNQCYLIMFAGIDDDTLIKPFNDPTKVYPYTYINGLSILDGSDPVAIVAETSDNRLGFIRISDGKIIKRLGDSTLFYLPVAIKVVTSKYYDEPYIIVHDYRDIKIINCDGTLIRSLYTFNAGMISGSSISFHHDTGTVVVSNVNEGSTNMFNLYYSNEPDTIDYLNYGHDSYRIRSPYGIVITSNKNVWIVDKNLCQLLLFTAN